jgi:hypothetical protein
MQDTKLWMTRCGAGTAPRWPVWICDVRAQPASHTNPTLLTRHIRTVSGIPSTCCCRVRRVSVGARAGPASPLSGGCQLLQPPRLPVPACCGVAAPHPAGNKGLTDVSARRVHRTLVLKVAPRLRELRLRGARFRCSDTLTRIASVGLAQGLSVSL